MTLAARKPRCTRCGYPDGGLGADRGDHAPRRRRAPGACAQSSAWIRSPSRITSGRGRPRPPARRRLGLPFTIQRATQFHDLVLMAMVSAARAPRPAGPAPPIWIPGRVGAASGSVIISPRARRVLPTWRAYLEDRCRAEAGGPTGPPMPTGGCPSGAAKRPVSRTSRRNGGDRRRYPRPGRGPVADDQRRPWAVAWDR